jgi:hypothetical protein
VLKINRIITIKQLKSIGFPAHPPLSRLAV